jgi:hypothetical protein
VYEALSLSVRPSFFLASGSSCFLLSFAFSKKSLTSFRTDPSVSSSVFVDHFRFFFGGCTNLKDCARELVANGC